MDVVYEVKVLINGEEVYYKEFKVIDSDKSIVKAAVLAGMRACGQTCGAEVSTAIDNAE